MYVKSMGKTLHALFRTYAAQLGLLDMCWRGDVIAVEESSLRDVFSRKVDMRKRGDAFCLGERGRCWSIGLRMGVVMVVLLLIEDNVVMSHPPPLRVLRVQ